MNNDVFINNGNQEYLVNEDDEESESIVYYEYGAHFKYKDLFDNLLKIKVERERESHNENIENGNNKIINNNIFINNNLNLNLFNNNKHKIISRNLQANNYINNDNILENSNTFISNLTKEQLNKTALLPSSELIQQKINDYLEKNSEGLLESEKMQPGDYVPKPDEDEIILQKKEDIHDSEGFIFTPKKVIEDSKKIMKNLKNLDI